MLWPLPCKNSWTTGDMSKSAALVIERLIATLTLPCSARQRQRIVARVIDRLEERSLTQIATSRGNLRFYALKSAYAASAVARFHTDEPETLEWIDSFRDGEIFWDVGANIGVYSLYAALNPKITVYAFEPSAFNFGLLVQHIALNRMDDVIKPLCIAFGAETGLGNLSMRNTDTGHAGNALNENRTQFQEFDSAFTQAIIAYRIDDLISQFNLPAPDHLKIDVDGIEPAILAGAVNTLPRIKSLLIEVEGRNASNAESLIVKPLRQAGLFEEEQIRSRGSGRNRLFINRSRHPRADLSQTV
jgi:FkbM family methyltransferase